MKSLVSTLALAGVLSLGAVLVSGCNASPAPQPTMGDSMGGAKMSGDNMAGPKMANESMASEKMAGDKMTGEKMVDDKMTGEKGAK